MSDDLRKRVDTLEELRREDHDRLVLVEAEVRVMRSTQRRHGELLMEIQETQRSTAKATEARLDSIEKRVEKTHNEVCAKLDQLLAQVGELLLERTVVVG